MRKKIILDIPKRTQRKNLELNIVFLNTIIGNNEDMHLKVKQYILYKLCKKKFNIKNYCLISQRSKSIYKKFKLSRMQIKFLCSNRILPGLQKASW